MERLQRSAQKEFIRFSLLGSKSGQGCASPWNYRVARGIPKRKKPEQSPAFFLYDQEDRLTRRPVC